MVKINQLWWRENGRWLTEMVILILSVGLLTAVAGTQRWQGWHQESQRGYQLNRRDYLRHPRDWRINGHPAGSQRAYYDYVDQYFDRQEFKTRNQAIRTTAVSMNGYFYGLALLAGLLISFRDRRRHFREFLLSRGVTRKQIWHQQLKTVGLVIAAVLISQCLHYAWVFATIPSRYLVTFAIGPRLGSGLAITLTSAVLLTLGWVVGNVSARFEVAVGLSLLVWHWAAGLVTSAIAWLPVTLRDGLPEIWLYCHYGVASLLAGTGMLGLLLITWLTTKNWSAETTGLVVPGALNGLIFNLVVALGGGSLLGAIVFLPFSTDWSETLGIGLVLLGMLVWHLGWRGRRRATA